MSCCQLPSTGLFATFCCGQPPARLRAARGTAPACAGRSRTRADARARRRTCRPACRSARSAAWPAAWCRSARSHRTAAARAARSPRAPRRPTSAPARAPARDGRDSAAWASAAAALLWPVAPAPPRARRRAWPSGPRRRIPSTWSSRFQVPPASRSRVRCGSVLPLTRHSVSLACRRRPAASSASRASSCAALSARRPSFSLSPCADFSHQPRRKGGRKWLKPWIRLGP